MTTAAEKDHGFESYGRAWLILFLGALMLGAYYWQSTVIPSRTVPPLPPASTETVDWFMLLRMPAVTAQYESGIDTMRVRYGEWLEGLQRAGFQPMRLSEVYARLKEGRGVPPKTVVLLFDPGFRRTFNIVAPILAKHEWPAVWITPAAEMDRGHREYLTYHKTAEMIRSGWWDVGILESRGHFVLKTNDQEPIDFGNDQNLPWARTAGGIALNRGPVFGSMNRLNVLSDWTTQDLVNRLRVEVPVNSASYLTLAPVQNLNWGVTTEKDSSDDKHFDLAVPLWRRGVPIAWFGTKTHGNFDLETDAEDLIGHLAFRLRWNEVDESGLVVTATKREWTIQQQSPSGSIVLKRLFRHSTGGFKMMIHLTDQTLVFSADGQPPETVLLPSPQASGTGGPVQIYLYDALKGSARVDDLRILFTPLP